MLRQVRDVPFALVWNRLTPQEVVTILVSHGFLKPMHPKIPAHLRASGVLDWLNFDSPQATRLLGLHCDARRIGRTPGTGLVTRVGRPPSGGALDTRRTFFQGISIGKVCQ